MIYFRVLQKETLAPNIMAMVRSFNRVALLVPTEILAEETPQARGKVISTFIKVRGEVALDVNASRYTVAG